MTSLEVATVTPPAPAALMSNDEIDRTYRLAKALSMSGYFKDARQAEQAFAKMLLGRDLGLSPTQALTAIHIIEGKPELSANLQATMIRQTPGYDFRVRQLTDTVCEIEFLRDGESLGVSQFTMDDAQRAGLAGRGPWKSYPRNMLYARALTNGVAWFCPEVTCGVRVYSEGEVSGEEIPPDVPDAIDAPPPALLIDESEASSLFDLFRSTSSSIVTFRRLLGRAGVSDVPADLQPEETRRDILRNLTVAQAATIRHELEALATAQQPLTPQEPVA